MKVNGNVLLQLLNSTSDAVLEVDDHLQVVSFNPGACQVFQYTYPEALGLSLETLFPQYVASLQQIYTKIAEASEQTDPTRNERLEIKASRKDGAYFPAIVSVSQVTRLGEPVMLIILRDISLAEESLLNSENRYRGLIESQSDLIVRIDMEGRFTFVNQVYCETFGKTLEELLGKSFTPLVHPDDLALTLDTMRNLYSSPYRITVEQRAMTVNGWRWFTWEDAIIWDKSGQMVEIQGIGRDITESKQNKQLLIAQRDLAQKLAGTYSMPSALAICLEYILSESGMDCGGIYLVDQFTADLNLVYSQGLSAEFVTAAVVYPAHSDHWQLVMQARPIHTLFADLPVSRQGVLDLEGLKEFILIPIIYQEKVIGCFNLASHQSNTLTPARQTAAEAIGLQVGSTITRLLAEEQLVESQSELETLFNTINDFIVVFDQYGKIVRVNQQVTNRLGYAERELLGQPVLFLHPPEIHAQATAIVEEMLQGRLATCPLEIMSKTGERIPVETKVSAGKMRGQPAWIGISRDISEQREADLRIQKSKDQLALAIEGSGVGLWDWMIQSGEVIFNERWAEIAGYTLNELAPVSIQTWVDLCHLEDLALSNQRLQEHFKGKTASYECELRMQHKAGHWVWVLDRGRVMERDAAGVPIRMTGTHLDITQRRTMENKLMHRLEFENLLTHISTHFINLNTAEIDKEITYALQEIGIFEAIDRSYIFLIDEHQNTMSNSHEWCREGIEPQIEMLQNLPVEIFPWWMERLHANQPITVNRVENLPPEANAEKEILQSQGILSVGVVPLYVNNQLLGFAGFDSVRVTKEWEADSIALLQQFGNIVGNLLERRRVENALRMSEERNSALLRAIPDNMFRINRQGQILDFIGSDRSSLVIPTEQIKGSHLSGLFQDKQLQVALEKIEQALDTGQKQAFNYEFKLQSQVEHFEARLVASGSDEAIAIVRNISERTRLEQMKSDFINRATHDLRTPLTTILLMVRLLEGECTPEEHLQYWNVMKEELERERVLVEDLLTVGRLESNQWTVKVQEIDPFECLRNSIQTVLPQATQKQIRIKLSACTEKFTVTADASSLEQVFTNLLNNAVKFTPAQGEVSLSWDQKDGKGFFKVCDTGIGIPPEDLSNLYTRFFRARNAIENEIPGSGIGLYIIKSMIEYFGGQINLQSTLGEGTTAEFWLPLAEPVAEIG